MSFGLRDYILGLDKFFTIQFNIQANQDFELRIINYIGELVYIDVVKNHIGEYNRILNFEHYSKAIYFLEIETNEGIINQKLVLQ